MGDLEVDEAGVTRQLVGGKTACVVMEKLGCEGDIDVWYVRPAAYTR